MRFHYDCRHIMPAAEAPFSPRHYFTCFMIRRYAQRWREASCRHFISMPLRRLALSPDICHATPFTPFERRRQPRFHFACFICDAYCYAFALITIMLPLRCRHVMRRAFTRYARTTAMSAFAVDIFVCAMRVRARYACQRYAPSRARYQMRSRNDIDD